MTTASAKRAWNTRRARYGKDGRLTTAEELKRTIMAKRNGVVKMNELRAKRKKISESIKNKEITKQVGKPTMKAITKRIARIRANSRWRPKKSYYYKGDQIRPFANTKQGMEQWERAVALDTPRSGAGYEHWEGKGKRHPPSAGFPHGRDKFPSEWLQAQPKRKIKKIV